MVMMMMRLMHMDAGYELHAVQVVLGLRGCL